MTLVCGGVVGMEALGFGKKRPAAEAASLSWPLFHGLKAMASTVASLCEALCTTVRRASRSRPG
jgi:hypothetical protein